MLASLVRGAPIAPVLEDLRPADWVTDVARYERRQQCRILKLGLVEIAKAAGKVNELHKAFSASPRYLRPIGSLLRR